MSIETVRRYFSQYNMADRIQEFDSSSATVEEAAEALKCQEKEIAKTMSFIVDNKAVLIVISGDSKIDNTKYKAQFHTKAVMLKPDEVDRMIGHPVGGVCPFGIDIDIAVYLDVSLKRFEHVYPACGSRNSAIKLTLEELEKYSGYREWIEVSKNREDQ
jgi:prolyl-tRNA editing enzyme YbaK/EbsC (Cys-tRNA(Pro) deacylase)